MIFGFFKGKSEEDPEDVEVEPVRFLGALNGEEANLAANARLAEAGLVPAKDLITEALSRRAETIRIEPKGAQSATTLLVDGIPYPGTRRAKQEGLAITQILKLLAGLDIKQRKVPQSGGIKAEFDERAYHLMLQSAPVADGERLTIRAIDQSVKRDSPTDIGMTDDMRVRIRELAAQKGLFAVVGPPGSGVSTTLYACLRGVDAYIYSVYTVGDVEGRKLMNITAFEANEGDDVGTSIDRMSRAEADVVKVEPLKDPATAKMLLSKRDKIAILTEFSAKDTAAGVVQLLEWTNDPAGVAEGLNGLVTQKLIRLLCTECKHAYRPKPDFLKKVGLSAETTTLYRKPPENPDPNIGPCEKCDGMGYFGRVAMFELLEMSDDMRKLVATRPDASALRSQMRKEKMVTLQRDALRLVAEGLTSLEEVQRIFKAPG